MKTRNAYWLLSILIFIAQQAMAQSPATPAERKDGIEFRFGLYYNSHLNYYGRTDSLRSAGFFPLAECWFGQHVYINAAPVFVHQLNNGWKYAGSVITAGYQGKSVNEKILTNVSVTKPLYESGSGLVQSALKAQLSGSMSFQNKFVNLNAGADIKWSDQLDYGLSAGIDHIVRQSVGNGFVIVLDPAVYVYGGTQHFAKTYYRKSNFLLFPGVEESVSSTANRFVMLSYEFSMPVILARDHLQLILLPDYVVPENLLKIDGNPGQSERGQDMLSFTAGLKWIF